MSVFQHALVPCHLKNAEAQYDLGIHLGGKWIKNENTPNSKISIFSRLMCVREMGANIFEAHMVRHDLICINQNYANLCFYWQNHGMYRLKRLLYWIFSSVPKSCDPLRWDVLKFSAC